MGGLACSNGSMCPSLGSGNTVVFSDAEVATHDSEPECVNLYIYFQFAYCFAVSPAFVSQDYCM